MTEIFFFLILKLIMLHIKDFLKLENKKKVIKTREIISLLAHYYKSRLMDTKDLDRKKANHYWIG